MILIIDLMDSCKLLSFVKLQMYLDPVSVSVSKITSKLYCSNDFFPVLILTLKFKGKFKGKLKEMQGVLKTCKVC